VYTPALWNILDGWVREVPVEDFKAILPVLRRTFSRFSPAERKMLLQKAISPEQGSPVPETTMAWAEENYLLTMPVLRLLLGLEEETLSHK